MTKLNLRTRAERAALKQLRAEVHADLEWSNQQQRLASAPMADGAQGDLTGCEPLPPGLDQLPDHKWPSRDAENQPYYLRD